MDSTSKIFRILDAATNRGREAVRVIEDLVRFICDDRSLMELLKTFRHDYAQLTKAIPQTKRMLYRDTEFDVGVTVQGKGEYQRSSYIELATANFCRLQESLRSIEEFSKIVLPQISAEIEQLRYRSYILEKKTFSRIKEYLESQENDLAEAEKKETSSDSICIAINNEFVNHSFGSKTDSRRLMLNYQNRIERVQRLSQSSLYVLVDTKFSDEHFLELIASGVDLIQLRDKTATDREIVKRGRELRHLLFSFGNIKINEPTKPNPNDQRNDKNYLNDQKKEKVVELFPPLLIMNDRPDLAILANFDGVHIGQDELTVEDARQIVGQDLLVGLSTHSLKQAKEAFQKNIDYIGAGPTFPSQTKNFETFPGLSFLKELKSLKSTKIKEIEFGFQSTHFLLKPIFAIGGISLDNLESVLETGMNRVAVSSAISRSENILETVALFKKKLEAKRS